MTNTARITTGNFITTGTTLLRLAHVAVYQHQSSIEKQQFNEPQQ